MEVFKLDSQWVYYFFAFYKREERKDTTHIVVNASFKLI